MPIKSSLIEAILNFELFIKSINFCQACFALGLIVASGLKAPPDKDPIPGFFSTLAQNATSSA